MLHFYYSFTEPQSEEITMFLENAADGEILMYPYDASKKPQKDDILISDDADLLRRWKADGGLTVGYEHDGIRPGTEECISDISEVYAEDLEEIADYLTEQRHLSFFSGDYDFYIPGYKDFASLYEAMKDEPYLLPERLKNLSEEELHADYRHEIQTQRMNANLSLVVFAAKDSDEILGRIAVEPSELSEQALNLSYYILPGKRGKGIGTAAVKAFLARMLPRIGNIPLLAVIHRSNTASAALAKACGFTILPADQQILEKRPEGFFTMIYDNSADA
ncbi:MAG: GNAT family N-acetyltransferase [Lachnospiraceae bacterium]|nr:GNAT family N-acetyltransferase [Lachnospiraceae bacterium]